jgi:cytochrome c peroxidase
MVGICGAADRRWIGFERRGAGPGSCSLGSVQSHDAYPDPPLGVGTDKNPPAKLTEFTDPPTPQRVRLGRWLFFGKRLSADNTIACATCLRSENAFSEPTPVSTGIGGQKGGRKAPSFTNQAWTSLPHFLCCFLQRSSDVLV